MRTRALAPSALRRTGVLVAGALLAAACSGGGAAAPDGSTGERDTPGTSATAGASVPTTEASTTTVEPGLVPGAQLPAPQGDLALYHPPDVLTGLPGDVVWARPRAVDVPGAQAWTVLYLTSDDAGELAAVSGVVIAPTGVAPPGGRPVVAWAHGTVGSADRCAPSRQDDVGVPDLAELLAAGYVVAATDYPGLGTPGVHAYLDGAREGRSVLDVVRAARHLTEAQAGPDVVVWGHSQGGHAALFAVQLAPVHAPELRVRGVAVAAPVLRVSDLVELAGRTTSLGAFYLMAAAGLVAAHPELDATQLLSPVGAELLPRVETDCLAALVVSVVVQNQGVGTGRPLAGTPWGPLVAADDLGPAPLAAPVLVVQGSADPLVLPAVTEGAVAGRCRLGDTVELRAYPGATHDSVLAASREDVLAFFRARFAGTAPRSTCSA